MGKGSNGGMSLLFTTSIIILPKEITVQLVIDPRYLNSITNLSNYSLRIEPEQMLLIRPDMVYYTTSPRSDLASTHNQVPLSEHTERLTGFINGGKQ